MKAVFLCVFDRQDSKQLSFQLRKQLFVLYDVMPVISAYMDSFYVFICDWYDIADEENGL